MPVTKDGQWAFDRDEENKGRGDAGSTNRRMKSIMRSGVIENRGGPHCFEKRDARVTDRFDLAHQATLLADGAKKLWLTDPGHANLQRFLREGAKHC